MAEITNNYVVTITPEMAEAWLADYRYEYQRTPSKATLGMYEKMMREEAWLPGTNIKLARTHGDDRKMLMDGQHRLLAVVGSGMSQAFTVTEVRCRDENEVALVYATTDRGRARNVSDLYRTVHLAEELGLSAKTTSKAGAALQFIHANFNRSKTKLTGLAYSELLATFRQYGDAIGNYVEVTKGTPHRLLWEPLYRASTFSVGIVTYQHAVYVYGQQMVDDFWGGIAMDDGLRRTDPRKVANIHIATIRIGNNSDTTRVGRLVSSAYSARYLAACWNAWTENRSYSDSGKAVSTKVFNANAPIKINGTPWKG